MTATVLVDACVLFPPLVRRIVLGAARAGLFRVRWSVRILDEWQIAVARRHGAGAEAEVAAARQAMAADFPDALVAADPEVEASLHLPDPADAHVLAAARGADVLLTFNVRDFPRRAASGLGVEVRHPDGFLWEQHSHHPAVVAQVVADAMARMDFPADRTRATLRRAQLPRLGKALEV